MPAGSAPFDPPPRCSRLNFGFCHGGTFWAVSGSNVCRRRPDAPWETWDAGFSVSWLTPWNGGALAIALPEEGGIHAAVFSPDGGVRRSQLALPPSERRYQVSTCNGVVHLWERIPRLGPSLRHEVLLLPGPAGEVTLQPVYSPVDASVQEAFLDAEGELSVLCTEGIYRPSPSSRGAGWKVRFGDETVAAVLSANGLVLHDRWFVGSTVFDDTIVFDVETLRLRRSGLPIRRCEALLLWSAWLSGRRPLARRLLNACWRHPELAPGERSSVHGGGLALREGADGRLEILAQQGLVTVPPDSGEGRFDPEHPAAPLLCAWELHLREPEARRWAMETLLVANDPSELLPALRARIGRRIGSRLLRFVRGRPTEGLLRGQLAGDKVWFHEGRQLATRTLQAMESPDPAQALLATRGARSLSYRVKPGLFAWRSAGWRVAMRALVHPDPLVRQEAHLLGVGIGPWLPLRDTIPEEVHTSASLREEMLRVVGSDDPLGSPLGRLLAWSTWENASDEKDSGTALRFARWDREASLFAGYVQAAWVDAHPANEASSALVRSLEALGLDGFHAAFDGMLLGMLLTRAMKRAGRGPEAGGSYSLPVRLQQLLRVLAEWEGKDRQRPRKAVLYPDRATRREVALLSLVLVLPELTPPSSGAAAETCRSIARTHLALGGEAQEGLLAAQPRIALVTRHILHDVVASAETRARLCVAALLAHGATARSTPKGEGRALPLHLRLARVGTSADALEQRAREIAREPSLLGLIALLALADRGDAEALAETRRRREEMLRSARFLEDDGAIDVLLELGFPAATGGLSKMSP